MAGVNTDLENLYQQQDDKSHRNAMDGSSSSNSCSKPNTPPPMYGEIPGVVPFRQAGGVGPPPTYEEANDPTVPPPTYESLFGRVKEARKNSTGLLDFLKKLILLILGTIGCSVIIGITIVIPVSMIIVGSIHIYDCKAEPYIPIYLIVGGVFGVLKNFINFCTRCRRRDDEEEQLRQTPVDTVINCFLFAWFITGCVWIYRIYPPNYIDQESVNYCNRTLYLFSFWLITSAYIMLGFVTGCLCCISIASMTIQTEDH